MSKLDRSSLLKFLSKPRFAHEVAEHYGIPKKLASLHLQKAIKSGQVLVSEKPIFQTLRIQNGKPKRLGGFVYVFRNSPTLADGWAKFRTREASDLVSKPKGDVFSIRFLTKTHGFLGKGLFNQKLSGFAIEATGSGTLRRGFKTKGGSLKSEFDLSSARVKLTRRRAIDQLIGQSTRSTIEEAKSLSHMEKIRLFQALLEQPLPFLDLRGRFGISKQTIRGLVKNGLLMETWGPKAIGVRFKLTSKGKNYVKRLQAAAKYEPKIREAAFIRLKNRTPLQC